MASVNPSNTTGSATPSQGYDVFVVVQNTNGVSSKSSIAAAQRQYTEQIRIARAAGFNKFAALPSQGVGREPFINFMKSNNIQVLDNPTGNVHFTPNSAQGKAVQESLRSNFPAGTRFYASGASVKNNFVSAAKAAGYSASGSGQGGTTGDKVTQALQSDINSGKVTNFLGSSGPRQGIYSNKKPLPYALTQYQNAQVAALNGTTSIPQKLVLMSGKTLKENTATFNKAVGDMSKWEDTPENKAKMLEIGQRVDQYYKNSEQFKRRFLEVARSSPEKAKEFASMTGCNADRNDEENGTDVNQYSPTGDPVNSQPGFYYAPPAEPGTVGPKNQANVTDTPVVKPDGKTSGELAKEGADTNTDHTTEGPAVAVAEANPPKTAEQTPKHMERGELSAPSYCEDIMNIENRPASRARTVTPRSGASIAAATANVTGSSPSGAILNQAFSKGMGGFLQKIMGAAQGMGGGGGGGGSSLPDAFSDESARILAELIEAQKLFEENMGNSSLTELMFPDLYDGYSPFFDGGPLTQYTANLRDHIKQKVDEKSPINLSEMFCLLYYGDFVNKEIIETSTDTKNLYAAFKLKAIELGLDESGNIQFTPESITEVLLFSMKFATGYRFPFINIDKFKTSILSKPRTNSYEEVNNAVRSELNSLISDDNGFYKMRVFSFFLYASPLGETTINESTLLRSYYDSWTNNLINIGDIRPGVDYTIDQYVTASIKSFEALF